MEALLLVISEAMNDKYDYISWWLYEATDGFEVSLSDGSKKWCLKEPEALYEFIVNEVVHTSRRKTVIAFGG